MEKSKNYPFVMLCINILLCVLFSSLTESCIKDADDEEPGHPSKEDTVIINVDSTQVVADSTFKATLSYLTKEWMSEYVGYDPMQNANSAIRRLVYFSPDGTYDSHVQGVNGLQQDSLVSYKEFEHEHGLYSFDMDKQIMTYQVEYDSLLNFFTDKLEYNAGKVIQGVGVQTEYIEAIRFSFEKDGKRDWIRIDDNLRSIDDHSAKLIYIMKNPQ